MKFKEFLNEAPSNITASKKHLSTHVPSYSELINQCKNKVGYINDYDMISDGSVYALVDRSNEKVMAYSRIGNVYVPRSKFKDFKSQTLLWKDDSITKENIRYMFNQILDDHTTIFSDDVQTKGGKAFWKSMFNDYKGSRYYEIGYYDGYNDKLVPFTKSDGEDEFNSHYGKDNYTKLYVTAK